MRLLLALAAYAALTVSCFAQDEDNIRIQPGEAGRIIFRQAITDIKQSTDVIEIVPESDVIFNVRARRPGSAIVTAFGQDGAIVRQINVTVAGSGVRIYGTIDRDDPSRDYISLICTEYTCARSSAEGDRTPGSTSVATTRRNSRGDVITTTKNY